MLSYLFLLGSRVMRFLHQHASIVRLRHPVITMNFQTQFIANLLSKSKTKKISCHKEPTVRMKWSTEYVPTYKQDSYIFIGGVEHPEDIKKLNSPAYFFLMVW